MHVLRLATALLSTLALAPTLLALPLADASAPEARLLSPLAQNIPAAPAPKTHTYTRRARAHP